MQIKILSLNLFEGGLFWENIVKFFGRENPDIFCLQEVFNGDKNQPPNFQTIKHLKKLLPNYFYFYSPEKFEIWPNGQGDTGNAIFSRYPLLEKRTIFLHNKYQKIHRFLDQKDFSHYPKNLQSVVIDVKGKKISVCNLHGIWGLDGEDTQERLKMSQLIIEEIKDRKPLALMGDFNLKPNTQTIARIEKHLLNVFKDELITTFNMKHKTNPKYANVVVDMFFSSLDLKIIAKSCPDDDVSDHKPLLVTIDF